MTGPKPIDLAQARTPQELTDWVDELSRRIKSGEISAVACAIIHRDGSTVTSWAYDAGVDSARLLGGTVALQQRLWRDLVGE